MQRRSWSWRRESCSERRGKSNRSLRYLRQPSTGVSSPSLEGFEALDIDYASSQLHYSLLLKRPESPADRLTTRPYHATQLLMSVVGWYPYVAFGCHHALGLGQK